MGNMKEKFNQADKLNLVQKLQQESLQGRNILRKSKNKIVTEVSKNLKDDNEPILSSCVYAKHEHKQPTSSKESYLVSKPEQVTPTKGTFVIAASRDHGGCACEREPGQKVAIASTCVIQESDGTKLYCVSPDLRKMNEKTLPKSVLIDRQVPAVNDSCYLHKKDELACTFNSISLKVDKERRFANSQKICQGSTPKSHDSRNRCRMTNHSMVYKSLSESQIKSMWL